MGDDAGFGTADTEGVDEMELDSGPNFEYGIVFLFVVIVIIVVFVAMIRGGA